MLQGYPDGNLELLRRGIGPESIDLADQILPFQLPAGSVLGPEELHRWARAPGARPPVPVALALRFAAALPACNLQEVLRTADLLHSKPHLQQTSPASAW